MVFDQMTAEVAVDAAAAVAVEDVGMALFEREQAAEVQVEGGLVGITLVAEEDLVDQNLDSIPAQVDLLPVIVDVVAAIRAAFVTTVVAVEE